MQLHKEGWQTQEVQGQGQGLRITTQRPLLCLMHLFITGLLLVVPPFMLRMLRRWKEQMKQMKHKDPFHETPDLKPGHWAGLFSHHKNPQIYNVSCSLYLAREDEDSILNFGIYIALFYDQAGWSNGKLPGNWTVQ